MNTLVYCGSMKEGILTWLLDETARTFTPATQALAAPWKSFFLAAHPTLPLLYSLDLPRGLVCAFAIETGGALRLLNEVPSSGGAPCHLEADAEGRFLLVANYNGDPAIFPLDEQGRLGPAASTFHLEGSGPDAKRQTHTHPHGINLTPEGAWVSDLGTDRISALTIAPGTLALAEDAARSVSLQPGDGPRHLALSPCGRFAAVVNELSNTVTTFRREEGGALTVLSTRSTLPAGYGETTHTAEIAFHPSAPAIYATNRGHDSVAILPFDAHSGALGEARFVASPGKPQALALNQAGTLLLVANMEGGTVSLFAVDPATGQLEEAPLAVQAVDAPATLLLATKS